jgi:hypothetical protein
MQEIIFYCRISNKKEVAKIHGIGELLKTRRMELGLDLADIENETKIRVRYLQAIEEEDFDVIPGRVYLKGFIKTYAKHLDLADNEEIIRFLEENKAPAFEIEKNEPLKRKKAIPKAIPKKYVTVLCGIFAILILFGMQNLYERFVKEPENIPPKQETGQMEEQLPPITQEPPEFIENEPDLPKQKDLIIEILDLTGAQEKCWLQVYSDNNLVYEGTMYEGDKKIFSAEEKIKFKLGNAGVVKLVLGETDLGIPGKTGQVIEREIILAEFQ